MKSHSEELTGRLLELKKLRTDERANDDQKLSRDNGTAANKMHNQWLGSV